MTLVPSLPPTRSAPAFLVRWGLRAGSAGGCRLLTQEAKEQP